MSDSGWVVRVRGKNVKWDEKYDDRNTIKPRPGRFAPETTVTYVSIQFADQYCPEDQQHGQEIHVPFSENGGPAGMGWVHASPGHTAQNGRCVPTIFPTEAEADATVRQVIAECNEVGIGAGLEYAQIISVENIRAAEAVTRRMREAKTLAEVSRHDSMIKRHSEAKRELLDQLEIDKPDSLATDWMGHEENSIQVRTNADGTQRFRARSSHYRGPTQKTLAEAIKDRDANQPDYSDLPEKLAHMNRVRDALEGPETQEALADKERLLNDPESLGHVTPNDPAPAGARNVGRDR